MSAPNRPNPLYDTRMHFAKGIQWRGFLYAPVPQLSRLRRVMIVEDHDDYLIVSDYKSGGGWTSRITPYGPLYKSERIGRGKMTMAERRELMTAIRELQNE